MNEIREIVTKAIVAKGKKVFNLKEEVPFDIIPYSILGVWIINHEFEATRVDEMVKISGNFEINVWYSSNNNEKTDILGHKVKYIKDIKTKQIVKEYLENTDDILAKIIKHPTCLNAKILNEHLELDIQFEILAEIIGETKMQVTVFNTSDVYSIDDEIDANVEELFLNT